MQEETTEGRAPKKPALWNSCRLIFAICIFFGFLFHLCMRLNLSFTMQCMVKRHTKPLAFDVNSSIPKADLLCARGNIRARNIMLPAEFSWSKTEEGFLISAYFYGYILGQIVGGMLSGVCRGKILFIVGLFLQSICTLLFPTFARINFYAVMSIRIIQGLVAGLVIPSAYQMYTVWAHPSERQTLVSLSYSGFPVGSVIIFPLSSALCQLKMDNGWPMVFYVIGGVAFSFSIALFWLIYDDADAHPRITTEERQFLNETRVVKSKRPPIPIMKMLTSVPIWAFCAAHFCASWGFASISLSIPQLMKEVLHVNITWNGLYSSAPFIASLITRLLLALTYHRIFIRTHLSLTNYRKIYHVIGSVSSALILLIICFLGCESEVLIVVLFGFLGAVQDLSFIGSYWTSYLELAPAFAGTLSGFTNTLSTITGIITPNVISVLVPQGTKYEWNKYLYIMISLYLFSAVSYAIFGDSKPLPWGQFVSE